MAGKCGTKQTYTYYDRNAKKKWTLFLSYLFSMAPKSGLSKFKATIETRSRNKSVHPGQIVNDAKQKRRTHEEMEKIRAEDSRMQEENAAEQAENLQKAADIEDQMRREDINRRSSNRRATGEAPFRPYSSTVNERDAGGKGQFDLNLLLTSEDVLN